MRFFSSCATIDKLGAKPWGNDTNQPIDLTGGPISPTSWQQLHLLHNYNCCSAKPTHLYTCFSWAVWSALSTLAHVLGLYPYDEVTTGIGLSRTRSPPLCFMVPWYLYVHIWCDKNDIYSRTWRKTMPNPCWGKLIFVRLYGCLFTEILICTFKPIFSKKCKQPKSMSPRAGFPHQPFSLQFHRYSALHIGHRIQTLDLSGLPTKPRQSWDSAANVGESNDHEVGGVSSLQIYPGNPWPGMFLSEVLLVFWALRPYDPWKPEANPRQFPLRFGDVGGSTWNTENTNMGAANILYVYWIGSIGRFVYLHLP